ncbi:DNA topoisomerase [Vibrio jasicida]|uniref:DNA topoisomerase n=1 Tax=Vibrio jasicida TaxID=766224 RepID=UPI000CE4B0A2|nr:DNA topoisomerase [Vibrio jasicida]
MRVFIAEKPSLAAAIFKGLGGDVNTEKKDGYYQHGQEVVTWCVGHLLALCDPEDYNIEHKKWALSYLPLSTHYPPRMKPRQGAAKQLKVVLSWIDKADSIVHAGDPDPEGCLLVDEVLTYANNTKPVQRVLIADLNDKPVKAALANLQPNEHFQPLTQKALARTIADQTFGYNLTRAYTLKAREKGFDEVLNIGRVITAMIGMINERTLANQNHQKSFYYELFGHFDMGGNIIKGKLIPDEAFELDDKGRMISSLEVAATKEADTGANAHISSIEQKTEHRQPPMPFNLSKLQIEASKRWGYKPKDVLDTLQGLYEKHKLLTYPRSDNQYLSDAHLENRSSIFAAITGTLSHLDTAIEHAATTSSHKAFNASKIEAHHAIVPTEKSGAGIELNDRERNLYELVAKRFIALFYPGSVRDKVLLDVDCTGRCYRATQTTLSKQGWEVLFKGEHQDEPNQNSLDLASMAKGTQGTCTHVDMEQRETKPPKYFDDASLLKAMTQAAKFIKDPELRKTLEAKDKDTAGENGSIGTEATRSGHIEKVGKLTHLVRLGKEKGYKNPVYKTTAAGQEFCALLPDEIVRPDISAIWEGSLDKISKQQINIESFLSDVNKYIHLQVEHVKTHGVPFVKRSGMTCPTCQQGTLIKRPGKHGPFHACNRYPDCKTTFPDDNGKPNFNPKPRQSVVPSTEEFCKQCGSPLVRRPAKKEGSFWWGCSGFPKCKVRYFDQNGKPDRDRGEL